VDGSRDRYSNTSDFSQKKAILNEIVSTVMETGRFLKRGNGNRWVALTAEKALQKTAHAIQYRLRKERTGSPVPRAKTQIPRVPQLLAPYPQLTPFDAAVAYSQATWDWYRQWMVQSNAQFWQYPGPEARGLHPDNVTAKEPLRSNMSADASEDHGVDGGMRRFSDDSHPGAC
jgi:hypothetical protein